MKKTICTIIGKTVTAGGVTNQVVVKSPIKMPLEYEFGDPIWPTVIIKRKIQWIVNSITASFAVIYAYPVIARLRLAQAVVEPDEERRWVVVTHANINSMLEPLGFLRLDFVDSTFLRLEWYPYVSTGQSS